MSTAKPNLSAIASGKKSLIAFVAVTLGDYSKVATQLHQSACMTFFHTAQYGDCDALNLFYQGLRVNDQTALRVWIGKHATYLHMVEGEETTLRPWIKFSQKDGFTIVKGLEDKRKDLFTIDTNEEGKTMLLSLKPFYDKNVKDKDAITLEALITMLAKAGKRVKDMANKENVALTPGLKALINEIDRDTAKEMAAIKAA